MPSMPYHTPLLDHKPAPTSKDQAGASTATIAGSRIRYGHRGTYNATNAPGPRTQAVGWVSAGSAGLRKLYLFGGRGFGSNWDDGMGGFLGDLWSYMPQPGGGWVWEAGESWHEGTGRYKAPGRDPRNMIGPRAGAVAFPAPRGGRRLRSPPQPRTTRNPDGRCLFGGAGHDSTGNDVLLSDTWCFTPDTPVQLPRPKDPASPRSPQERAREMMRRCQPVLPGPQPTVGEATGTQ